MPLCRAIEIASFHFKCVPLFLELPILTESSTRRRYRTKIKKLQKATQNKKSNYRHEFSEKPSRVSPYIKRETIAR